MAALLRPRFKLLPGAEVPVQVVLRNFWLHLPRRNEEGFLAEANLVEANVLLRTLKPLLLVGRLRLRSEATIFLCRPKLLLATLRHVFHRLLGHHELGVSICLAALIVIVSR